MALAATEASIALVNGVQVFLVTGAKFIWPQARGLGKPYGNETSQQMCHQALPRMQLTIKQVRKCVTCVST